MAPDPRLDPSPPPLPRPAAEQHWRDQLAGFVDDLRDRLRSVRTNDGEPARLPRSTMAWALAATACAVIAMASIAWFARPDAAAVAPEESLPYIEPQLFEPSPTPTTLVVHVAGAVNTPGVYRFDTPVRVGEAIAAAGGATLEGDLDRLNLAAPLADGERVYVPGFDEVGEPMVIGPTTANSAADSGPLNINTASATDLETLPGVGPTTALAIVAHRTNNGPFATVAELDEVAGIGPAKLAQLQELVTVG